MYTPRFVIVYLLLLTLLHNIFDVQQIELFEYSELNTKEMSVSEASALTVA